LFVDFCQNYATIDCSDVLQIIINFTKENAMLPAILTEKMQKEGLSERAAARQCGMAHTTFGRAVRGETVDVPTLAKIAQWLGVPASTLVDIVVEDGAPVDTVLANKLAMLISTDPELKEIFLEALERVEDGRMSASDARDLARYAAFRMGTE
jgi:transcriptional regulator with XRE-family HTH domain